ncbi:hypothetical protein ABZ635_14890 [Nocardiopsis sp. NPDC007018]|uniref:hypothetical protein n=1 Tax=Nocardiopsis sp. NPDC007018 TaxID=3155721 RepID=UPI0033DA361B
MASTRERAISTSITRTSNDFLTSAQSVTVTIPAHAGQFSERGFGTGFWVRVG